MKNYYFEDCLTKTSAGMTSLMTIVLHFHDMKSCSLIDARPIHANVKLNGAKFIPPFRHFYEF